MRISSAMIYETGVRSINNQMTTLLHNQQMLSSGRRIVAPSDDPVAASRALVVTEAQDINTQFASNQGNATSALKLEESQMSSLGDLLVRVRQLAVQGGDGALSASDLKSITAELRSRFEELMGIANTTDSNGDFIFSGNMGGTKPFGGNVDGLNAAPDNEVTYAGDSGQRNLQVSPTRFLQTSDSGNDIFRQIPNGNGNFVTNYAVTNTGTATIDAGSVLNPATWNAPTPPSPTRDYSIKFWVDTSGIVGTPNTTYYDLIDKSTGNSMLTGQPPVVPGATTTLAQAGLRTYHDNETIPLSTQPGDPSGAAWTSLFPAPGPAAPVPFDLGANVNITGQPATGDTFSITPSTTQSVFKTLANLIGALEGQQNSTLSPPLAGAPAAPMPYVAGGAVDGGGTLDLTVNGVTKQIQIPPAATFLSNLTPPGTSYNSITLANAINAAIADPVNGFGSNVATASGENGYIVLTAPAAGSPSAGLSVGATGTLGATDIFMSPTPANGTMTRSSTALSNQIGQALTNIDQAYSRLLTVRAAIGSRLNELDSLSSVNQDVNLRYQETLSNLQDVDYAKTISDMQQNQNNLDAAQKSYMKVTQLSLFQYL